MVKVSKKNRYSKRVLGRRQTHKPLPIASCTTTTRSKDSGSNGAREWKYPSKRSVVSLRFHCRGRSLSYWIRLTSDPSDETSQTATWTYPLLTLEYHTRVFDERACALRRGLFRINCWWIKGTVPCTLSSGHTLHSHTQRKLVDEYLEAIIIWW